MADDKHIVRDVQRAESTKVVTGDYVSPNGFGSILSGIAGGFGNLIDAAARGSRASAEKAQQSQANIDLYNLYKGAADELASSNMTEEKFLLFDKQLHKQALSISGGDYGAISKAMELAQYNPSFENVKKLYTRNAANQYAEMNLVNTAGSYAVGVDAPASAKERAGQEYLTRQVSSNSFITNLFKTSPGQQSAMINGDSTPGLADTYVLIKSGFRDVMTKNKGANPGVLFNNYYNNTVTKLVNGGMDFAVASKLVDRALVLEKSSIFSEDADASSSFNRLKLAQDYQSKQNQLTQDIALSRILAKKFKFMIRDPQTNQKKEVYISGADLGEYDKNFSNTMKVLKDNQYFELVPQLFQEGPQTYSSSDLNFFYSADAGRVMDVNSGQDNKKVMDNVVTGQNQALDDFIKEKESADPSTLKGKGFADIRRYNQIYQGLKAGTAKFADSSNAMALKDNSFESIAKGTNIESDGEGFWQVDESGNLHYYTPTKWMGDYILLDSTDSSRFMGMGSSGASNMRRYSPEISQWLQNLERVFSMDKKRLYDDFNRSQIKGTLGAQSFRANQKSPSNAYYSKVAMDMSDEDVNSVLDAVANAQLDITGVSVGIAGRALSDIGEGVVSAAEAAGKAPIEIPRQIADDLRVTEGFAALTDVGLALSGEPQRRQKQRDMLLQQALERNRNTQRTTQKERVTVNGEKAIQRNNPGNIEKNPRNKWEGIAEEQDDSPFVTFKTMEDGYRAMSKTLDTYFSKGKDTIESIITRWAPPASNPTQSYISFVADAMGVKPDEKLDNSVDTKAALMRAMVEFENGAAPRSAEDIKKIIQGFDVKPISIRKEMPAQVSAFVAAEDFPSLSGIEAEVNNALTAGKLSKGDLGGRTVEEYAKDTYHEMVAREILRIQGVDPDGLLHISPTGVVAEAMNEAAARGKDVSEVLYDWYSDLKAKKSGNKESELEPVEYSTRLVDTMTPEDFVEPPTINIDEREVVTLGNGEWGTEDSIIIKDGNNYVVIPTIINGKKVPDKKAIKHYYDTNEHLGKFKRQKEADEYAEWLHKRQEQFYGDNAKELLRLDTHNEFSRNNPGP